MPAPTPGQPPYHVDGGGVSYVVFYLRLNMELVPVSPSLTSMLRLASGVPNGTFSGMLTLEKDNLMNRKEKPKKSFTVVK